jgi:hypothetical protein
LDEHLEGGEYGEYVINSSCGTVKMSNCNMVRKWEYIITEKAMYILHNIEACLCPHCHGKAVSIAYYECVLFSLMYLACNLHVPYCRM